MFFNFHSIYSLFITITIECLASLILFRSFRNANTIFIVILANCLTHPLYSFLRKMYFPHEHWLVGVAILEPVVVLVEAVIYHRLIQISFLRATSIALALNVLSLSAGIFRWL